MKGIKIKIGCKVYRYKRFVNYRIKSNVSENMRRYINFLISHHGNTIEELATSKYIISKYFEPFLDYRKISVTF